MNYLSKRITLNLENLPWIIGLIYKLMTDAEIKTDVIIKNKSFRKRKMGT